MTPHIPENVSTWSANWTLVEHFAAANPNDDDEEDEEDQEDKGQDEEPPVVANPTNNAAHIVRLKGRRGFSRSGSFCLALFGVTTISICHASR